jgi:ribosome recycling factor
MEAMRKAWTDERLDDLTKRVDEGFCESREDLRSFRIEVKTDFASLRGEMDTRFDKVDTGFDKANTEIDTRFDKVDARFDTLNARFDAMQRLMIATLLTFILGLFLDRL